MIAKRVGSTLPGKLGISFTVFSIAFFGLRFYGNSLGYDVSTLVSDLGGLAYLYSTVGTMFAMFAAFVIVSESQDWNMLNSASKGEVRELRELFLWSQRLESPLSEEFNKTIETYLQRVIHSEWPALGTGKQIREIDQLLASFHDLIARASIENNIIGERLTTCFEELLGHRDVRIEYSWQPLPSIIKLIVVFVDVLLITLSMFIGVKSIALDYIFTGSIFLLGIAILVVIDDLDHPLRPGDWFLKTTGYERLLQSLRPYHPAKL